jgi:hypothetical protein
LQGVSAVLPTLSKGLEIQLSDCEVEHVMLNGDYIWKVVEILIGSVPSIFEVCFMHLFLSLSRILLQGFVLMKLFHPMRHQVDLWKVEVGI